MLFFCGLWVFLAWPFDCVPFIFLFLLFCSRLLDAANPRFAGYLAHRSLKRSQTTEALRCTLGICWYIIYVFSCASVFRVNQ